MVEATQDESETLSAKRRRNSLLTLLMTLQLHFGTEDKTKAEWKIILESYVSALSRWPVGVVSEACSRYLLCGKFFPKIADLVEIIEPLHQSMLEAEQRRIDMQTRTAPRIEDHSRDWTPEVIKKMKTDAAELSEPWRTIVLRAVSAGEKEMEKADGSMQEL